MKQKDIHKKIIYCVLIVFNLIMSLVIPIITQRLIDAATIQKDISLINKNGMFLLIAIVLFVVSLSFSYFVKALIEENYIYEKRKQMIRHINITDYKELQKQSSGFYLQRFNEDVEKIRPFILEKKVKFVTNIIYGISMVVIMLLQNYLYTLLLLAVFPLFVIVQIFFSKKVKKYTKEITKLQEKISTEFEETINNNYMLRANNSTAFAENRLKKEMGMTMNKIKKKMWLETVYDYLLVTGLLNLASFVIYFCGGRMILGGSITLGMLTSFSLYYSKLWVPVEFFLGYPKDYTKYKIYKNRVNEITDADNKINYTVSSISPLNNLIVKNLFYSIDERILLNDVTLKIQKGQKIGIIGANGSGKSTLANILSGIIIDYEGEVLYNNQNIKDIHPTVLREKIALIPASVDLINASVLDNIALGNEKKDKSVFSEEFIKQITVNKFFDLETIIETNGSNISSGEAKMIQLARGLYRNADLYIFDEPINYIDANFVSKIMNFIKENFSNKTVIIISHDKRALSFCEDIYSIEDTKLVHNNPD